MPTVAIVDDHPMVLHGLRAVLKDEHDLSIVGEASDRAAALELLTTTHPDLLLLDLMLPDGTGIDLLQQLASTGLRTRVLIFSMHSNDSYVRAALRADAAGFVLKDSPASELLHAIHEVLQGRRYLSPAITGRAIEVFLRHGEDSAVKLDEMLTARERQVFQLVVKGATNIEIAERLAISPRTVEAHRANLMRKLGLKSHTDLLRHALAKGMLPNSID